MSEIKFSDGMPVRERRSSTSIYPEELLDKKCGGCVRCQSRDRRDETGYHCTAQPYIKDISAEDKACVIYWDKEEEEKHKALRAQDEENRRKELWNIYSKRDPIKLPIVNDGYGMIPECPICGSNDYEYISFSEDCFGIVERHGSCERCGYIVEQAYSPIMEAYRDIKRGIKTRDGYIEKNAKKHKRIRKKCNAPKMDVNPIWAWYA